MEQGKSLTAAIVWVAILILTANPVMAQDECARQNARIRNIGESINDEEICAGYETCQFFDIIGTLKGSGAWYRMFDWTTLVADNSAVVVWAEAKIETKKGDLWLEERCVVHLGTGRAACTSMVWGGTGEYDGATGWLAHAAGFPEGTQLLRGEICPATE